MLMSFERDFASFCLLFFALPLVAVGARFTGERLRERFVLSVSESVSESMFLPKRYFDFLVLAERVSLRVTCRWKRKKS